MPSSQEFIALVVLAAILGVAWDLFAPDRGHRVHDDDEDAP